MIIETIINKSKIILIILSTIIIKIEKSKQYILGEGKKDTSADVEPRVTVEAADIDGIAPALGIELVDESESAESRDYSEELRKVLETLADIYVGVQEATETDSRGRSRKMVRQYADREDLSSDDVGHLLRVLEAHDLVVQDGNRWRIPEGE